MTCDYCVVSIGTLAANRLWGESAAVRTSHATTTLVTAEDRLILVDPSLPAGVLQARLNERTGKTFADITDVFCTTLRPVHRRGIDGLAHANWWCSEAELDAYARGLAEAQGAAGRIHADTDGMDEETELVARFRPCPAQFGRQVSLYPLTGPSPGSAGLLLTPPTQTILIAGDAAITAEHVRRGQVWQGCHDTAAALETLADLLEIAETIVCGHDNVMITARPWL